MRPVRVWNKYFVAHADRGEQRGHDRACAAQRDGDILRANFIAIDALDFGGYQFAQPGPANRRAIGNRFVVDGFDGRATNMLRRAETRLSYLQPHGWRQYFSTRLRLALQLLSVEAERGDVVDRQVVNALLTVVHVVRFHAHYLPAELRIVVVLPPQQFAQY